MFGRVLIPRNSKNVYRFVSTKSGDVTRSLFAKKEHHNHNTVTLKTVALIALVPVLCLSSTSDNSPEQLMSNEGNNNGKEMLQSKRKDSRDALVLPVLEESHLPAQTNQVVINNSDGSVYTGMVEDNLYHGEGVLVEANGRRYEGSWVRGKRHGKGVFYFKNQFNTVYTGEWKDDFMDGKGEIVSLVLLYKGDFKRGVVQGTGTLKNLDDGINYTGQFKNGLFDGRGTLIGRDGVTFTGQFKNNKPHGRGIIRDKNNKVVYEGEVKEGTRHGAGVAYSPADGLQYHGFFVRDRRHGDGVLKLENGSWMECIFHDNAVLYGKYFDRNGKLKSLVANFSGSRFELSWKW
jgi:hypothetical protein